MWFVFIILGIIIGIFIMYNIKNSKAIFKLNHKNKNLEKLYEKRRENADRYLKEVINNKTSKSTLHNIALRAARKKLFNEFYNNNNINTNDTCYYEALNKQIKIYERELQLMKYENIK